MEVENVYNLQYSNREEFLKSAGFKEIKRRGYYWTEEIYSEWVEIKVWKLK